MDANPYHDATLDGRIESEEDLGAMTMHDSSTQADASTDPRDAIQWIRSRTPEGGQILWMQTEVTQELYSACINDHYCTNNSATATFPGEDCTAMTPHHPAKCITQGQADDVCRWLDASLPSSEEFEFEASNGGTTQHPWGDTTATCVHVNHRCVDSRTRHVCDLVGGLNDNRICNLADNVGEWTRTSSGESGTSEVCGLDLDEQELPGPWGACHGSWWNDTPMSWTGARCVIRL
ncbi:MAG: SUMF1/EgtB/PvdO family nonheme iron enzyme [Sandaracinaceae bacterium]|nr:SUMF1/EgtB/PvdO family nonheme iron enzyme [Sandaracinaceae bacterium]MBK8412285.1 SUMF1/EgtB/PvdO family nonheme iron enzyme [Sandaracinaceae bacterium]